MDLVSSLQNLAAEMVCLQHVEMLPMVLAC